MKKILLIVLSLFPLMASAKVSDFNELISDNIEAQADLHNTVKRNVVEARTLIELKKSRERVVFKEKTGATIVSPTQKDFLAFKKEKTFHRASEKRQLERFANEMSPTSND